MLRTAMLLYDTHIEKIPYVDSAQVMLKRRRRKLDLLLGSFWRPLNNGIQIRPSEISPSPGRHCLEMYTMIHVAVSR